MHTEPHESLGVHSFSLIGFKHCTHTCGGGVLRERKGQRNRYLWGLVRCKSVGNVGGNVKVSLWVRVGLKISHIRFLNNFFLSNLKGYDALIRIWERIRGSGIRLYTFGNLGHGYGYKYGYGCPSFSFRSHLN